MTNASTIRGTGYKSRGKDGTKGGKMLENVGAI
jgi:hypothetical protein